MKKMKCNQLGGPADCEHEFTAETFDEIAQQSRKHAMENMESHREAMEKMGEMMQDSEAMQKWMDDKKAEFDAL